MLLNELKRVRSRFGFKVKAWVVLPDHFHLLIKPGKADYSKIIYSVKKGLSLEFKRLGAITTGEKLWQDRFWETMIKDESHYERCVDYIHFNPVKHGFVRTPVEWKHSSIHEYVSKGIIPSDWGDGSSIIIPGAEFD